MSRVERAVRPFELVKRPEVLEIRFGQRPTERCTCARSHRGCPLAHDLSGPDGEVQVEGRGSDRR